MGGSYYSLSQFSRAEEVSEEALRLSPRDSEAYLLLGIVELHEKDLKAAVVNWRMAVGLKPQEALFHRELGMVLFKDGHAAESKKQLDEALAINPKDAAGYFGQAKLLTRQGARQEAITNLNVAVELRPDYSKAYTELA